jgi:hypothetical protein
VPRGSWDNVVGIATGYALDDRGVGVRVPVAVKNFLFSPASRPTLGLTQPPVHRVLQTFLGIKLQGREADHSTTTTAEVKKMWLYTAPPPHAFMA